MMEDHWNISFPGYLKLWQLQDPKPCLSGAYNALFIDEAQDCTPGTEILPQAHMFAEKQILDDLAQLLCFHVVL